jgi:hypothetical protein
VPVVQLANHRTGFEVERSEQVGGRLAKIDRLDAEALARFGEMVKPAVRPLPNEQTVRQT